MPYTIFYISNGVQESASFSELSAAQAFWDRMSYKRVELLCLRPE